MPRIIAGTARGIKLETNAEELMRPTTDRFKEAVFSSLHQDIINGEIASFLDLFGGCGQIALEAKSRGVNRVVLVEQNRKALKTIYNNVVTTKLKIEILSFSAKNAIKQLSNKGQQFDIIYFDPPWQILREFWQQHEADLRGLLRTRGRVIIEHHRKYPPMPDQNLWSVDKRKHYSDSTLLILSSRDQKVIESI